MFITHALAAETDDVAKMWINLLELTKKYQNQLLIAGIYTNISTIKQRCNKLDEAKYYLNKAITVYQKTPNATVTKQAKELINNLRLISLDNNTELDDKIQYDLAYTLTRLGTVLHLETNIAPAIQCYNQALEIYSKIENKIYIKEQVQYQKIDTLFNLSRSYMSLGELVLTENLLNNAKQLADHIYINHRQQGILYLILANLYNHIGKFKNAEQLLKDSLNILSIHLPKQHFEINIPKIYMAYTLCMLGNITATKNLLTEAVLNYISENANQWDGLVKLRLARIYESLGKYDKALSITKESLYFAQKLYKEKLHDLIKFQFPNAEIWTRNNNIPLIYLHNMLELNINLFGEQHHQVARYHFLLGQALANIKKTTQAIVHYEKALNILNEEEIKHPDLFKFHNQNIQIIKESIRKI